MTRRTRILLAMVLALAAAPGAHATTPNPHLTGIVDALPDIPLVVHGELQKRNARGRLTQTYQIEMVLDWNANIPTARYTIRDAFGATLQHLAITWDTPGAPSYRFFEGSPLRAAPLPPLNQPILETDITWLDLSLSFLWWPGGEPRGTGSVRGRTCDILDVAAPEGVVTDFDGVRLWVERRLGIVMRAEGYDAQGKLRRRMEVRSFKKIRDRWVLKDLEFQSFPEKTRTSLLVRDVEERERFDLPDRDFRPATLVPDPSGEWIDELPALDERIDTP